MSIPSSITTALTNLQAQVIAAEPMINASRASLFAIQLNTDSLLINIQKSLTATSILDTYSASTNPALIVSEVLQLATAATDQNTLSTMRGYVGRADKNIDQVSGEGNDADGGL